jgi:hypothetical protein
MAIKTIRVCDKCDREERENSPVRHYNFTTARGKFQLDLCDADAEPIRELEAIARPPGRRRTMESRVVD